MIDCKSNTWFTEKWLSAALVLIAAPLTVTVPPEGDEIAL
jgi:hypothetical protein